MNTKTLWMPVFWRKPWLAAAIVLTLLIQICTSAETTKVKKTENNDERVTVIEVKKFTPPPPPADLVNCPTIGIPKITIPDEIKAKMGPAILPSATQKMKDILINSKRFKVIKANGDLTCEAIVTDFSITRQISRKSTKAEDFLKKVIPSKSKKTLPDIPYEADWNKDDTIVTAKCGVSLNFVQNKDENALAAASGLISMTDSANAIRIKMLGIEHSKTNQVETDFEVKSRLFELAAEQAMLNSFASLDPLLAKAAGTAPATAAAEVKQALPTPSALRLEATPATVPAKPADVVPTPADTTAKVSPKFCSECGNKLTAEAKFCASCGKKI